jgi:hypothetical protein
MDWSGVRVRRRPVPGVRPTIKMQMTRWLVWGPLLVAAHAGAGIEGAREGGSALEVPREPAAADVTQPLDLEAGAPAVQVLLDGRGPYRFLLDLGAGPTRLDEGLAAEVGLMAPDTAADGKAAAPQDARPALRTVRLTSLSVGSLVVRDVQALVVDLGEAAEKRDPPRGILGVDLFKGWRVTLDSPYKKLHLARGNPPSSDAAAVVSYKVADGRPMNDVSRLLLPISIGNRAVEAALAFDAGSRAAVMLPAGSEANHTLAGEPQDLGVLREAEKVHTLLASRLEGSMRIGSLEILLPSVWISEGFEKPAVGTSVLHRLAMTLDPDNGRIFMKTYRGMEDPVIAGAAGTESVTAGGLSLRDAFTRDRSKARLLLILSPT